jgi:hypothetical protein
VQSVTFSLNLGASSKIYEPYFFLHLLTSVSNANRIKPAIIAVAGILWTDFSTIVVLELSRGFKSD